MSTPQKSNDYAIPGSSSDGMSVEELNGLSTDRDLMQRAKSVVDYHLLSLNNTHESPKYMTSQKVFHLAKGCISINYETGDLDINKLISDKTPSFLSVSQKNSSFTSRAESTIVGSLNLSTIDGFILNPLNSITPSTPFTPNKGWLKQLFPQESFKSLSFITILELVQAALLSQINNLVSNNSVTNIRDKKSERDLGTIIIENSDKFIANGNI